MTVLDGRDVDLRRLEEKMPYQLTLGVYSATVQMDIFAIIDIRQKIATQSPLFMVGCFLPSGIRIFLIPTIGR